MWSFVLSAGDDRARGQLLVNSIVLDVENEWVLTGCQRQGLPPAERAQNALTA
jgi:hypothetical protein